MSWMDRVNTNALDWLLEPSDPAVAYLTRRDLLDEPARSLTDLHKAAHQSNPIALILAKMDPQGFWVKPGPGYGPKYHSTVWSMISLAQMGASIDQDERIQTACRYVLDHALKQGGHFSASGTPSSTFDCLQGNLCWALTELGCRDERLEMAFDWIVHSITGEGVASNKEKKAAVRYYAYKCAPNFACGANGGLPCAWGALKVMRALGNLPVEKRPPLIRQAIQMGIDFLLSVDPAQANYPTASGQHVSQNWWKFGFPVFYISDMLEVAEVLVAVGAADDPRLANVVRLIRNKQDEQGRWNLEYNYAGKVWGNFGTIKKPNKWVTLRALRVLKKLPQE